MPPIPELHCMINAAGNKPYSADVCLSLTVHGHNHELAKVGPNRVVLRNAVDLPPGEGILSITIDGQTTQRLVCLPEGASAASPVVTTSN